MGSKTFIFKVSLDDAEEKSTSDLNPSKIELIILKQLAKGKTQLQVSKYLKVKGYTPHSLSSIEKRLKMMRESIGAKTLIELFVIISKDGTI